MDYSNWKMYLVRNDHLLTLMLMILILPLSQSQIKSECVLSNLPKLSEHCVAQIDCSSKADIESVVKEWNCIQRKEHYQYYDSYGYGRQRDRVVYDDIYDLHVNLYDITDDTVVSFGAANQNIKTIKIRRGNIIVLPSNVYNLPQITDIEITDEKLENVNLNKFSDKHMLEKLNVSNNIISLIETDETEALSPNFNTMKIIDLSHNLIGSLPNNCFSQFTQLQYLNLSHNSISSFEILTFEGINNLKYLQLSNNKLHEIGHTLVRFVNLKELLLDHNQLSALQEPNLMSMLQLETLNVSYNSIESIEDMAFRSLLKLENLDLRHNHIKRINKNLLKDNSNLHSLYLSSNNISVIEAEAFADKNIVEFFITDNCITGTLEKNTFQGINVKEIDLSGENIKILGDEAFSALGSSLLTLNVSTNLIETISQSAFKDLVNMRELDLSNNVISDLNIDTDDLKNLTSLYVRNNKIRKIWKHMFTDLVSLTVLDLSFNSICEIESHSFENLTKLEVLTLNNNVFTKNIEANVFKGLIALNKLEFSNTRVESYQDAAFSGMTSLIHFNASFGELSVIGYNAFKNTNNIELLDFSHNLLEDFSINHTSISRVKKIFLNNNKLRNITIGTFSGLSSLELLELSNNNIIRVDANAFRSLVKLVSLYLSLNPEMEISGNTFDNLTSLTEVSLESVKKKFNFKDAVNSSIINLKMAECSIDNINAVFVFKINNVAKLDLSSNKITFIDKFSFQTMSSLTWLDLSNNKITDIQPGSFLSTNMINTLDLQENDIPSLPFGVLDGLHNLRTLNLSSNAIHTFEANLFHKTPFISTIYIDNNVIKYINFHEFNHKQINVLSIGGNLLSCKDLVDIKRFNLQFFVTAGSFDYHSENVDGVSCKSDSVQSDLTTVFNSSVKNSTSLFASVGNSVDELRGVIDNFTNKTLSSNIEENKFKNNIVKSLDDFMSMSNRSYATLSDYMKIMSDGNNEIKSYVRNESTDVRELLDYMERSANITVENDKDISRSLLNIDKTLDSLAATANESQNMFNDLLNKLINIGNETQYIINDYRDEKANKNAGLLNNNGREPKLESKKVNDELELLTAAFRSRYQDSNRTGIRDESIQRIKVLLYFISACLAVIVVALFVFIIKVIRRNVRTIRVDTIHSSSQPIANVMEME